MKDLKLYFGILVLSVGVLFLASCSDQESATQLQSVNLKFKNQDQVTRRLSDSIFSVHVIIESTQPLRVISDEVVVMEAHGENGESLEGIALITNDTAREISRAGYIFNNATQCWIWGRYVTNTSTGETYFQPGTASEQAYHNVCAPQGSYYARP
ncbi:hypothetical protein FLLO111716_14365 [Flavobacterium longum]|uniref:hypothetical protein n=1 Tax=Flavobacterium longum TaxID=1299340 RepID=UPI0039ED2D6A